MTQPATSAGSGHAGESDEFPGAGASLRGPEWPIGMFISSCPPAAAPGSAHVDAHTPSASVAESARSTRSAGSARNRGFITRKIPRLLDPCKIARERNIPGRVFKGAIPQPGLGAA